MRRRRAYATLPHVQVEPLYFSENDLTADRMLAIMGCDNTEVIGYLTRTDNRSLRARRCHCTCIQRFWSSVIWVWMHSTTKASRWSRLSPSSVFRCADKNQSSSAWSTPRTWTQCKRQWLSFASISLTRSFVPKHRISSRTFVRERWYLLISRIPSSTVSIQHHHALVRTSLFLSYSGLTAGVLFDIVLGLFMQWQSANGKIVGMSYRKQYLLRIILTCVVVLDEAHKYLTNNDTARLTQSISSIIRLQRHLATRVIVATQVRYHRSIVTRSSCSLHVQEPTVIPSTMLDLASFIICHRFTSPSWCRHLARHVSAGDNAETAQWFQDVMLLSTGQCVVFSPSALVMKSNDGSVRLLGRDYLKLRVRPRLTLDGGTSLLAVGRTPLSIEPRTPIFDTPLTTASNYLPAQRELSYEARQAAQSTHAQSTSVLRDTAYTHTIPSIVPHSGKSGPSSVSANKPASTAGLRPVPAHLQYLILWLLRNGGADAPLNLNHVTSKLFWIGKTVYGSNGLKKGWWNMMLNEAEVQGLIEVTNLNVKKKKLKALNNEKTIRLLYSGPFIWV